MNTLNKLLGLNNDLDKYFVGFEDLVERVNKAQTEIGKQITNYPPYNIRKTGENTYQIEMAVAGFGKQDLEIELADNKLVIKGAVKSATQEDEKDFVFRGIGMRPFTRIFAVEEKVEVLSAELLNGMLKVALEKMIPEEKKAKKIKVKAHEYTAPNL
jgi:molecular chaperone IbpA